MGKIMVLMHEPHGKFAEYWQVVKRMEELGLNYQPNHQSSFMGADADGSTWSVTIWKDREEFEKHWNEEIVPLSAEFGLEPLPLLICPLIMELQGPEGKVIEPVSERMWFLRTDRIKWIIRKLARRRRRGNEDGDGDDVSA